ncbi:hypothetical protein FB107DRAFT_252232 [Schizophyllum commune]
MTWRGIERVGVVGSETTAGFLMKLRVEKVDVAGAGKGDVVHVGRVREASKEKGAIRSGNIGDQGTGGVDFLGSVASPFKATYSHWKPLSQPLVLPPRVSYSHSDVLPSFSIPDHAKESTIRRGHVDITPGDHDDHYEAASNREAQSQAGISGLSLHASQNMASPTRSITGTTTTSSLPRGPVKASTYSRMSRDETVPVSPSVRDFDGSRMSSTTARTSRDLFGAPVRQRKFNKLNNWTVVYKSEGDAPLLVPRAYDQPLEPGYVLIYVHRIYGGEMQMWIWEESKRAQYRLRSPPLQSFFAHEGADLGGRDVPIPAVHAAAAE